MARDVTARHGMAASAPPPLYLLAGVTHGAYFYGLYHFAFLECALPGVNQRPQFGQCDRNVGIGSNKHRILMPGLCTVANNSFL
jgi:hypothetical protein